MRGAGLVAHGWEGAAGPAHVGTCAACTAACAARTAASPLAPGCALLRLPTQKKKKWEPPAPPPRVGKKQKKRDAQSSLGSKLPAVTPSARCRLRLLKLERIKDYLLMEHEFVQNQEQLKPQDERNEEDRSKVRGGEGAAPGAAGLHTMLWRTAACCPA